MLTGCLKFVQGLIDELYNLNICSKASLAGDDQEYAQYVEKVYIVEAAYRFQGMD